MPFYNFYELRSTSLGAYGVAMFGRYSNSIEASGGYLSLKRPRTCVEINRHGVDRPPAYARRSESAETPHMYVVLACSLL